MCSNLLPSLALPSATYSFALFFSFSSPYLAQLIFLTYWEDEGCASFEGEGDCPYFPAKLQLLMAKEVIGVHGFYHGECVGQAALLLYHHVLHAHNKTRNSHQSAWLVTPLDDFWRATNSTMLDYEQLLIDIVEGYNLKTCVLIWTFHDN